MAARRPLARSARTTLAAVIPALAMLLGACSSDGKTVSNASSTIAVPTTFGLPTSTLPAVTTTTTPSGVTTAAPTTVPPPTTAADTTTTAAPTTVAPTAPASTTSAPECAHTSEPPAGVDPSHQIVGNVDGDGVDDTVTAYTGTDGLAHVFLQRGGAEASDVTVAFGSADASTTSTSTTSSSGKATTTTAANNTVSSVSISFEDFDHAAAAVTQPPLVVMAIGTGPSGTAPVTFLSAVENASGAMCLTQWTLGGQPFAFTIDQRGPFAGLLCDHAAGRTYYVLRTATPIDPATTTTTAPPTTIAGATSSTQRPVTVAFNTTATEIDHAGATVTLTELGGDQIPDDQSVRNKFGDIVDCDHAPLFP